MGSASSAELQVNTKIVTICFLLQNFDQLNRSKRFTNLFFRSVIMMTLDYPYQQL